MFFVNSCQLGNRIRHVPTVSCGLTVVCVSQCQHQSLEVHVKLEALSRQAEKPALRSDFSRKRSIKQFSSGKKNYVTWPEICSPGCPRVYANSKFDS